jgi:2,3-bisphosphoglycerate-independent phosphoglycerate mutase
MMDFTAGHISTSEASQLLHTAQERMGDARMQFVPGVSYRNLLVCRGAPERSLFSDDTRTTPPHDLTDRSVAEYYPRGPGSDLLSRIMSDSLNWFADHPVNRNRVQRGQRPATNVWLWGQGRRPRLPPFREVYGLQGAMISAVDLLRGLALLIGWQYVDVPGATGYLDTDYGAKGRYAVEALCGTDVVCVHIEAPDEASHAGDCAAKIEALERIDAEIVAPLHDVIRSSPAGRILITPDHPTPLRTKTHSHGPVPFAFCGTGISPDALHAYHEPAAAASGLRFDQGWKLMEYFLSCPCH